MSLDTPFAESVVQASIVVITTAAGKLQDDSTTDSLDPAVTLWLVYAFISVAISGALLLAAYIIPKRLPAARLSQVTPRDVSAEVDRLARLQGLSKPADDGDEEFSETKAQERALKSPVVHSTVFRWSFMIASVTIIVIGWVMFGLGVSWGVHGSVIAGTTGE
jgi:hypothetical protein